MTKNVILISLFLLSLNTISAQNWEIDFAKAKDLSSKEHKPIILVFQGSDWCAPCIKLDREIWNTDTFKRYATEHYVMLKADFPKRKKNALSPEQTKKNGALAEKYNRNGIFPFVVILDSNGKVLGETGYKKLSPDDYIKLLNSFIK